MVHERPRIAEFLSALGKEQASARQLESPDKVLTKGKVVQVPAESVLNFKRNADLHLEATRWYDLLQHSCLASRVSCARAFVVVGAFGVFFIQRPSRMNE